MCVCVSVYVCVCMSLCVWLFNHLCIWRPRKARIRNKVPWSSLWSAQHLNPGPQDNKLAADPSLWPLCMTINTTLKSERRLLCWHTSRDVAIRWVYKMASLSAESITTMPWQKFSRNLLHSTLQAGPQKAGPSRSHGFSWQADPW